MSYWKNKSKCSCIFCAGEYFVCMINQHQKNCKWKGKIVNKKLKLNIDYIICPICGKRLIEINNAHLNHHNLTPKEFDKKYPYNRRLSEKAIINKKTFTGKKHTEEHKKYMSEKMTGVNNGKKLSKEHTKKLSDSMEKAWENNYENFKFSHTKEGYIKKYGYEEGVKRWVSKNLKNSKSSTNINKPRDEYELYMGKVRWVTSISIKWFNYEIPNFSKFQIDHKVSICYGFNNNISPYLIGSIYNLETIEKSKNLSKQEKCSMEVKDLMEKFENDEFYKKLIEIDGEEPLYLNSWDKNFRLRKGVIIDRDTFIKMYENNKSSKEIADYFNISKSTVCVRAREWKVKRKEKINIEDFIEDYNKGISISKICKKFDIGKKRANSLIKKFNLKREKIYVNNKINEHKQEILDLRNRGKSFDDISKKFKFPKTTILDRVKEWNENG